ncbi:CDP-glucose 4,6-dehydratase [Undibacterium sp. SXout20W]|uniref:CDP-glucose 4,6-dehydratase n=1 Tax=Undibacterium sp. SXout20W TaxID=3413051 RepID=UPI003BEFDE92
MENLEMMPDKEFWRGRKVVLTGHTGFKGGWLAIYLHRLGAQITGIALSPETRPSLFYAAVVKELVTHHVCDIRDQYQLSTIIKSAQPEIVLHLAAQALVRESYSQPAATFATNVLGTVHVLDALRGLDCVKAAVMVTTDKVYRNPEHGRPFCEGDELGGHDPYSASKAASELVIASYRDAYLQQQGVRVASSRAGNVIGGGDWSADRLIPDAIRAWQTGQILDIRRPASVRPWQHVLEPLTAYLVLAQALVDGKVAPGAFNFGPPVDANATVQQVIELARNAYHAGNVRYADTPEGVHEAGLLSLNVEKARDLLGIEARFSLSQAVETTMNWYRAFANGADAYKLCLNDIHTFEALHE